MLKLCTLCISYLLMTTKKVIKMYMNSQKQQLIPKRLFETYRQWVSENPYFEKTCEEMNVKANSYAQLFHIYAQRKGLLSKKETVNEIIKTSKQTKLTEMI